MSACVLIVEDEKNWAETFRDILQPMGFEISLARDIKSALDLVSRSRYDLVLLDLCLDQGDFNLICKKFLTDLRDCIPLVPIVAATAKSISPQEAFYLKDWGISDFVSKTSLDVPELQRTIIEKLPPSTEIIQRETSKKRLAAEEEPIPRHLSPENASTAARTHRPHASIPLSHRTDVFAPASLIRAAIKEVLTEDGLEVQKVKHLIPNRAYLGRWRVADNGLIGRDRRFAVDKALDEYARFYQQRERRRLNLGPNDDLEEKCELAPTTRQRIKDRILGMLAGADML